MTAVGVGSVNVMVDAAIGICIDVLCGATVAGVACVLAAAGGVGWDCDTGDKSARLLWVSGDAVALPAAVVNWTTLCALRKAVLNDEWRIAKSPSTPASSVWSTFFGVLTLTLLRRHWFASILSQLPSPGTAATAEFLRGCWCCCSCGCDGCCSCRWCLRWRWRVMSLASVASVWPSLLRSSIAPCAPPFSTTLINI